MCMILHIPLRYSEISSRPLYPYLVVAHTERSPVLFIRPSVFLAVDHGGFPLAQRKSDGINHVKHSAWGSGFNTHCFI